MHGPISGFNLEEKNDPSDLENDSPFWGGVAYFANDLFNPKHYGQAITPRNFPTWVPPMEKEIKTLNEADSGRGAWDIVPRNEATKMGEIVYRHKWAYRCKPDSKKARVCLQGQSQIQDIDFDNSHASTIRPETLRMQLDHVAAQDWAY